MSAFQMSKININYVGAGVGVGGWIGVRIKQIIPQQISEWIFRLTDPKNLKNL